MTVLWVLGMLVSMAVGVGTGFALGAYVGTMDANHRHREG